MFKSIVQFIFYSQVKVCKFNTVLCTCSNIFPVPVNLIKNVCLNFISQESLLALEQLVPRHMLQMKNDQLSTVKLIQQVEEKAGEILRDQQDIIALDHRRNDDRVGMRALQKQKQKKAWITVGPLLLKMSSKTAEDLLVTDQQECDIEINKLRSNLKIKVNELRDLELNSPVPGLMLKPMSRKEMTAMKDVLG